MLETIESFPPIAGPDAKVLILGSMPCGQSLLHQQYYAHPRNAFWPIMARLLGFSVDLPYPQRCEQLLHHGIAVWDVLKQCQRQGSLDTNIERHSEIINDLPQFLQRHPQIRLLGFNGLKAQQCFTRAFLRADPRQLHLYSTVLLPSTSPAHAGRSLETKFEIWRQALQPELA